MSPLVQRYWEIFEELRPTEAEIPEGLYAAAGLILIAERTDNLRSDLNDRLTVSTVEGPD